MLLDFFKQKHECHHNNVPLDVDEAYCPDCGELIRNKWFLVRCSCCNIKRTAHTKYNEIVPDTKFCPNCGGTDFYVQELEKVNFIDVHYAVFKKIVIPQEKCTTRQIWIEEEENFLQGKKLISLSK
jgi:hypothetical protein